MIEHLPFPSLLALLTAICSLFIITGTWLYLLIRQSKTKQVSVTGFGISVVIDTRTTGRRATDRKQESEV